MTTYSAASDKKNISYFHFGVLTNWDLNTENADILARSDAFIVCVDADEWP